MDAIFKYFRTLDKHCTLPREMKLVDLTANDPTDKSDLLNQLYQSVFSPEDEFQPKDFESSDANLTDFDELEIFDGAK